MFKKLTTIMAAVVLTLSLAGNALAKFQDLELIRAVYERTTGTTEQITDMGVVSTILTGTHNNPGDPLTANNAANLFVSYFVVNITTGELWVSGDSSVAPVAVGTPGFNVLKNGTPTFYSYYNGLTADTNGVKIGQQSYGSSFKTKFDANQGALGNAINITTRTTTEANLATLVNGSATSVTQTLYYLSNANTAGSAGVAVATITTKAEGSTTIGPAPVLVNGQCGSSNNGSFPVAPTTGICANNTTASSVAGGDGPWIWTCAGLNGGTTANCSASVLSGAVPGVCGPSNGGSFPVAPVTGLCTSGTVNSPPSGTGPWSWTCNGSNGGTDSPGCSAIVGNTTPSISWPTPAPIASGTPLSNVQLNAIAKDPATSV